MCVCVCVCSRGGVQPCPGAVASAARRSTLPHFFVSDVNLHPSPSLHSITCDRRLSEACLPPQHARCGAGLARAGEKRRRRSAAVRVEDAAAALRRQVAALGGRWRRSAPPCLPLGWTAAGEGSATSASEPSALAMACHIPGEGLSGCWWWAWCLGRDRFLVLLVSKASCTYSLTRLRAIKHRVAATLHHGHITSRESS